jgi:hypothetical protein
MADPQIYDRHDTSWTRPATKVQAVTPSDSTTFEPPLRGFMVGAVGNVAVIAADDDAAVTLVAVAVGVVHPISCKKIMSTNTTATSIVGLSG